jgi:hypothetical protein
MFDTCSQTGATIVRRAKGRDRVADWIPLVMHSFSTVFWSVVMSLIFCSTAVANNRLPPPIPIAPVAGFSEVHPDPNVLVYWNGSSKFGGVLVKRGAHWYASFGLIVGLVDFLVQEVHVREGAVVFLHEGFDDFHTRSRRCWIWHGSFQLQQFPLLQLYGRRLPEAGLSAVL